MTDIDMSDAGGVSVQQPTDPLKKAPRFTSPKPAARADADQYSKLKKLQRNLEFLTLQEVCLLALWYDADSIGVYKRGTAEFEEGIGPCTGGGQEDSICAVGDWTIS
jgi:hypothetical protein